MCEGLSRSRKHNIPEICTFSTKFYSKSVESSKTPKHPIVEVSWVFEKFKHTLTEYFRAILDMKCGTGGTGIDHTNNRYQQKNIYE